MQSLPATSPSIATESDVKHAILAAHHVGYSTGPSGDHLLELFDRWGISAAVKAKLVQARPGIPVASLVASGEVERPSNAKASRR